MSKRIIYFLRWIAVLPGAIIFCILVTFPIHWVILLKHYFWEDSFISGIDPAVIERTITPFFMALLFVWISSFIAPSNKFITAIIMASIWTLSVVIIFLAPYLGVNFGNIQFTLLSGGLPVILGVIGAIVGLLIVYKQKISSKKTE